MLDGSVTCWVVTEDERLEIIEFYWRKFRSLNGLPLFSAEMAKRETTEGDRWQDADTWEWHDEDTMKEIARHHLPWTIVSLAIHSKWTRHKSLLRKPFADAKATALATALSGDKGLSATCDHLKGNGDRRLPAGVVQTIQGMVSRVEGRSNAYNTLLEQANRAIGDDPANSDDRILWTSDTKKAALAFFNVIFDIAKGNTPSVDIDITRMEV
eukprot:Polyplicarium_translucidae@DN3223_c0_g3_i1.p2